MSLIRIKDNLKLKENEYRIIIKGITVKQGSLESSDVNEKVIIIVKSLKEALYCNIQSIIE